jgi:hypothetical protein
MSEKYAASIYRVEERRYPEDRCSRFSERMVNIHQTT